VDDARLRQVLANLVSNAVKFTGAGTVEVLVAAELASAAAAPGAQAEWRITFAVRDTGIGIAPEHHAMLFKPFSQVDESTTRRYGGTGLGLAISQNLVQLMGGEITVKSASGCGSEFKFTIPAQAVPGMARAAPDLGGLRIALAAQPGPFRDDFKRLAERWRVEMILVDAPANLAKTGWDIAFVDLDADLARQLGSGSSASPPWPAAKTYGLVSVCLENGLRTAARAHFCQLINRPLHHDSLLGLLAGIKPSTASEKPPAREFGLNILVVEDNLVNQRLVQKLLSNLGCKPTVAGNGRIALEELARTGNRFDLALMDLHMPELDGLGAIEKIRAGEVGEKARSLWIAVLTADARAEQKERVLAAGANDYLVKPVSLTELAASLRRYVVSREG
jgi:CheY-like chemotaxis protein